MKAYLNYPSRKVKFHLRNILLITSMMACSFSAEAMLTDEDGEIHSDKAHKPSLPRNVAPVAIKTSSEKEEQAVASKEKAETVPKAVLEAVSELSKKSTDPKEATRAISSRVKEGVLKDLSAEFDLIDKAPEGTKKTIHTLHVKKTTREEHKAFSPKEKPKSPAPSGDDSSMETSLVLHSAEEVSAVSASSLCEESTGAAAGKKAAISFDGGGIRGYMQAVWLDFIQGKDLTNRYVHQLFDYTGGTSIGGINCLGAVAPDGSSGKPKVSTQDLMLFFTKYGEQVFPQRSSYNVVGRLWDAKKEIKFRRYDVKPLEELVQKYFGQARLQDTLANVVITSVDARTQRPFLFSTLDDETRPVKIWQAARATSAAPTYFDAYQLTPDLSLIDGGLYRNNPAGVVIKDMLKDARARKQRLAQDQIILVSLGTGVMPLEHIIPGDGGWLNSAQGVIETMMNACSLGVHEAMCDALESENYLRINPVLEKNIALDQATVENLGLLKDAAGSQMETISTFFKEGPMRKILEKSDSSSTNE